MESYQNEQETAIERWKDNRLKKLEDFTRDIIKSANEKKIGGSVNFTPSGVHKGIRLEEEKLGY